MNIKYSLFSPNQHINPIPNPPKSKQTPSQPPKPTHHQLSPSTYSKSCLPFIPAYTPPLLTNPS